MKTVSTHYFARRWFSPPGPGARSLNSCLSGLFPLCLPAMGVHACMCGYVVVWVCAFVQWQILEYVHAHFNLKVHTYVHVRVPSKSFIILARSVACISSLEYLRIFSASTCVLFWSECEYECEYECAYACVCRLARLHVRANAYHGAHSRTE